MNQGALGKTGYIASIFILGLCAFIAYIHGNFTLPGGNLNYGICYPSPNLWLLKGEWGSVITCATLVVISLIFIFFNKRVNLTRSPALTPSTCFLVMAAAFPWMLRGLNSGVFMALVNVISLRILFSQVNNHREAPQRVFLVASLLSFGTMVNYGFIWLMPVYLVILGLLRIIGVKEICAFLLGVISPYVIVIGFGLVDVRQITPKIWMSGWNWGEIPLMLWISLGFTALLTLILSLYNAVRLFSAKKHIRYYNASFNTLGAALVALMVLDLENACTYVTSLLLVLAVAVGHSLAKMPQGGATFRLVMFTVCYLILFALEFRF